MVRRWVLCAAFCGLSLPMAAKYLPADLVNVPVERLVRNLESLLATEPAPNIDVRLNLARLHAMAYARKVEEVPIRRGREADGVHFGLGPVHAVPFMVTGAPDAEAERRAHEHLENARAAYRELLALRPDHLVARLGYAWCLAESGARTEAIAAYRETLERAWVREQEPINIEWRAQSITEEAATFLIPLLDAAVDRPEILRLRWRIETINSQATRSITPIAVPLRDSLQAKDLMNERASVAFDADGSGLRKRWTWITPDAGWLVQDVRGTGQVTSALQLFGSVSWWLFWANGYDALRALDDNRDGVLNGGEIEDLGIWRDLNANGVSESGEVQPLSHWQIVSLSYAYQRHDPEGGAVASSPAGVTFADGTTRPTFDLILRLRPSS